MEGGGSTLIIFVQNLIMSIWPLINKIHVYNIFCSFSQTCKANKFAEYYGIRPYITFLNNYHWNTDGTDQILSTTVPSLTLKQWPCGGNFSSGAAGPKVRVARKCVFVNHKYYILLLLGYTENWFIVCMHLKYRVFSNTYY